MGGAISSGSSQIHHGRYDDVIYKVAEAISDDRDLRKLGLELGLTNNAIFKAITKNWEEGPKTTDGNKMMLRRWANTFNRSDRLVPTLNAALGRAGLAEIAETCLQYTGEQPGKQRNPFSLSEPTLHSQKGEQPRNPMSRSESALHSQQGEQPRNPMSRSESALHSQQGEQPGKQKNPFSRSEPTLHSKKGAKETMPDGVRKLSEKLKKRYVLKFGEVKTSVVDPASRTWLPSIFVSLVLILKSSLSKNEKTDQKINIDQLYKLIENSTGNRLVSRVAFLGDVGVGKSTLFSKIALDWATGECLQDVNLLFYEAFSEMEESPSFVKIVMNMFPDITSSEAEQINKYMYGNQRKVVILMDDLDESKMNFLNPNLRNAVVSIVRGDILEDIPVLISTRPFVVDVIKTIESIYRIYIFIEVKGFTKKGTRQYINRFFQDDKDSAISLTQFIECNKLASELLAPFPIFCSMLCNIWKTETTREAIRQLGTSSQLLEEICFSLKELYSSKHSHSDSEYECNMTKAGDAMKKVASFAFEGLLENKITFESDKDLVKDQMEAAETTNEVGILKKEKTLASRLLRRKESKHYIETFCFPHKLLQEYIASFHFASMYEDNPLQFNNILENLLLVDCMKYRDVLFFTVSHGANVGKSVLESLCRRVDDINFIIEVAFECHYTDALDPVKNLLKHTKSTASDYSTEHIFAAHVFALETYGKQVIEEVTHLPTEGTSKHPYSDGPSNYARALCHMPSLRSLKLAGNHLQNEEFYTTMAAEAKESQIVTLNHEGGSVGPTESHEYAKAIVSMPKLQNLQLCDVELSDNFYPKMADGVSDSGIVTLKHKGISLGRRTPPQYARAIVSMPNLQNLELSDVEPSDNFYSQMAEGASHSKIVTLKHAGGSLGPAAASQYAKAIVSLPQLQDLELNHVKLNDNFYQPFATKASKSEITRLKHVGGNVGPTASSHYARALCSMPNLQSLELENVRFQEEAFYKGLATEAAKAKVEVFRHADTTLRHDASSHYGQGLFSMPNLRSLELDKMSLDDEFYKCMATKAPTSKIAIWRHVDARLSPGSSYHYAKGIFAMPKLISLELCRMWLSDSFYASMADEASKSKIEKWRHVVADLGKDASYHYAKGLCTMPNLQSLELHHVKLTDDFYASMAAEALQSKIHTLRMEWCEVNRHILRAVFSLPKLQSLSLVGKLFLLDDKPDKKTATLKKTSVYELSVDCRGLAGLWKIGLHTSCPRVKVLALNFYGLDYDSSNTITTACSPFRDLTELRIDWQKTLDPAEFCRAVKTSCPRLHKLSLSRIKLGNDNATEIIQTMKIHPHLSIIELDSCWTDEYLDIMITEVNNEGKLTATVKHGPARCAYTISVSTDV